MNYQVSVTLIDPNDPSHPLEFEIKKHNWQVLAAWADSFEHSLVDTGITVHYEISGLKRAEDDE